MTDEEKAVEDIRFIECSDNRFEIIKRAKEHIIDVTNIESKPEEMQVLDNFLFRCWQMGWLKNDFHQLETQIEELKKEISVLLSCANCQENKGGYVCEREYNDKCLAQKIEYIKELKEEIEELKELHESDKKSLKLIIDKAKEQIELLSNDNHVLKTSFICQKEQVEKMKLDIQELKNTFDYFPINSAIDEILEKWESKN